ncbi:GDSL-type esterase/lipase family protein [Sinomonas gamaensis]|uniref:GDSL-type esterase/lipase family protein n=1 Tax=Sinomonas gamaensis TaxID=2565624 RepID=UPI001486F86B
MADFACSRAVTASIAGPQGDELYNDPPEPPQIDRIRAFSPDIVILWIGGNDIGFADLRNQCVLSAEDCTADRVRTERALSEARALEPRLKALYESIVTGSRASLYVPAYPQIFDQPSGGDCGSLASDEAAFGAELIETVDNAIRKAAADAAVDGYRVKFVASTQEAFAGHGACQPDPLVHTVTFGGLLEAERHVAGGQELLHPTEAGYEALTSEVSSAIAKSLSTPNPPSRESNPAILR